MEGRDIENIETAQKTPEKTASLSDTLAVLDKKVFDKAFSVPKEALKLLTEKPEGVDKKNYIAAVLEMDTKLA